MTVMQLFDFVHKFKLKLKTLSPAHRSEPRVESNEPT